MLLDNDILYLRLLNLSWSIPQSWNPILFHKLQSCYTPCYHKLLILSKESSRHGSKEFHFISLPFLCLDGIRNIILWTLQHICTFRGAVMTRASRSGVPDVWSGSVGWFSKLYCHLFVDGNLLFPLLNIDIKYLHAALLSFLGFLSY